MYFIIKVVKNWTLPISMLVGSVCYVLFTQCAWTQPVKPYLVAFIPYLLPALIFMMLLLAYVKIDPKQLKPRRWHLILIVIQLLETLFAAWWCISHRNSEWLPLWEALLAVFVAPMAAVGAVVTQKIGGNPATATTYTVISSLYTAVIVPLVYPLVEPGIGMTFFALFWRILSRVFPTIIVPLILALGMRWFVPKMHQWVCREAKDKSFYLWAICTAVNTAQIIRCIVNSPGTADILWSIVVIVGSVVALQFYIGKKIGSRYNDRIAAGQGLAQKNTVLSIWIAMTFLSPTAAIGPGVCLLWQNVVNSWQIWKHEKESHHTSI